MMGNDSLKKPNLVGKDGSSDPQTSDKIVTDHDKDCLLNDEKLEEFKKNPFGLFQQWFQQAFQTGVPEPFIMSLATSSSDGVPSVRPIALGNVDEKGFYFATNVKSNKVEDLNTNPKVAVSFYWSKLDRSIRVAGDVEAVDDKGETFHKWPRTSQISEHSSFDIGLPLQDRKEFVKNIESLTAKFANLEVIPKPDNILTYRISPKSFEFLQDHTTQPADRILFKKDTAGGSWNCTRLTR